MFRRDNASGEADETAATLMEPAGGPSAMRRRVLACAALALIFFAAVAPTLTWIDFSNGSENLNVATVTEMLGDGGRIKLLPTLQLRPRTNKPPLTAWVTASFVPVPVVEQLASPDPATRAAAQRALAWRARLPALLAACGIVVATYLLAETIAGPAVAWLAALACATTLTLLRQSRLSTTDIQLALWVTVANVFIARGLLGGMTWANCLGAGLALALAMMSKGPVGLVQTLAPAAVWLAWMRWNRNVAKPSPRVRYWPMFAGLALMLVGGLAWFAYVLLRTAPADMLSGWMREVTREGATTLPSSDWYNYVSIFASVFPWTVFLIVGLVLAWQSFAARRRQPLLLAVLMLVVPILIMSLFRDRKERYLLPMVGPAAIVIAWGVREHLRNWDKWTTEDTIVTAAHWIPLGILAVGVPVAATLGVEGVQTIEGKPWYGPAFGWSAAIVMAALVAAGVVLHARRWRGALVTVTVVVMLLLQAMVVDGYSRSRDGVSVMKDLADTIRAAAPPGTPVINLKRNDTVSPADLSIYLPRPIPIHSTIPAPDGRPLVVLLYQRRKQPVPKPPPGFERLARATEKGGTTWHAFLRR